MKEDFLNFQAQTTPHPLLEEVVKAEGSYIYTSDGKSHLDFVAGVSACGLGHQHPVVIQAIKQQVDQYMHVMVYGEYALAPAVEYCKLLAENLPPSLQSTYLVNSGTEAIDGAMKLARRATGKTQIIAAKNAYHGNSYGALSLMDYKERTTPFEPMVGDITHIVFNQLSCLSVINTNTAAVILETIQGGAGFILPTQDYLKQIKKRCEEVGALLILDEIQPGFGRTGKLFGFQHYDVVPDILVIGKAMASGLPCGAFISSKQLMSTLSDQPKLGHITTFGGNPVIASSALATLKVLLATNIMQEIEAKEKHFRNLLQHELIREIRGKGLMLAMLFERDEIANQVVLQAKEKGLILFWLLFEKKAVRISPPLTISLEEIEEGCQIIIEILNQIKK